MRTNDVYLSLQCLINPGCSQNTHAGIYIYIYRGTDILYILKACVHSSVRLHRHNHTNTDALLCSVMMALSGGHYS